MRITFLDLLACPVCGQGLMVNDERNTADDGHVVTGNLVCRGCQRVYPIVGGVPRLLPTSEARSAIRENTAERFAFEWTEFSDFELAEEEDSMATWFRPMQLSDLAGKTCLDAGCGMGRHATIAARHGVSRLLGLDLGHAVDAAFANTRHLESVCIVQGDIYYPPLASSAFDCAYSLGVLHHVPDPKRGFEALAPAVRPGGWFQVWLYGRDSSGIVVGLINAMRRVTAVMPLGILKMLSWALTLPVWLAAHTVYRIPGIGARLPIAAYMEWLLPYSFRKVHAIVFDQLLAPVAYYMTRAEVEAMVDVPGCSIRALEQSRGMSWGCCVGRNPDAPMLRGAPAIHPLERESR